MDEKERSEETIPSTNDQSAPSSSEFEANHGLLTGWQFWCTMVGIYTGLFLVTLEMTVVSTALVNITDELHTFSQATWVVNAYFLTWSGFLLLWAQFSQTIGRKPSLLAANLMFIIFSAACGGAQTATQLIVFRSLQGIAGAGLFSMPIMIVSEAVPPMALPKYTATMAFVTVISFVVGPLMGGAIVNNSTWRWVFYLNLPPAAIAGLLEFIGLPKGFPHHRKDIPPTFQSRWRRLRELDSIGAILYLAFSILLVTVLQEAGNSYAWNSGFSISLLIIAAISLIMFTFWERYISLNARSFMPLVSWAFVRRRPIAMFVSSAFIGIPFVTTLLQIPQRLQVVNEFTALQAGISLLPFIVLMPVGTMVASIMSSTLKVKSLYGTLLGTIFQFVGVVCFATVPTNLNSNNALPVNQYVFEAILGFGNGLAYTSNFNGMPYALDGRRELVPAAMGAVTQFRYLGGVVGVGMMTAALNTYVRNALVTLVDAADLNIILQSSQAIAGLQQDQQLAVRQAFSDGFELQWRILSGLVGAQFFAVLLTI